MNYIRSGKLQVTIKHLVPKAGLVPEIFVRQRRPRNKVKSAKPGRQVTEVRGGKVHIPYHL